MLSTILILLLLGITALLAYASTRPDTFRIERSMLIQAPAEKVFPHIDDLHNWNAWSPWAHMDPAMTQTYGGALRGTGATQSWSGNSKVGQGSMEIIESAPSSRIVMKLDFLKPFEAHNTAEFSLTPEAGATRVTWAMHGPSNFMSKVMGIFMNMDAMVGGQFEQGLANLKRVVET